MKEKCWNCRYFGLHESGFVYISQPPWMAYCLIKGEDVNKGGHCDEWRRDE